MKDLTTEKQLRRIVEIGWNFHWVGALGRRPDAYYDIALISYANKKAVGIVEAPEQAITKECDVDTLLFDYALLQAVIASKPHYLHVSPEMAAAKISVHGDQSKRIECLFQMLLIDDTDD